MADRVTAAAIPARLEDACADVRLAGPADAVAGVGPRFVAAPASAAEAGAVLRAAAGLDLAVVPRGGGTRLDWGAPPTRCDLVVETRRLDRVVEHAAGDLVVTVEAGVPLDRLATVLAAADQRLALDPAPAGPGGTVGGLVAAGVAGPLRLRYGAPRDLLLGVTMVRADGTIAHSGGKVVKNVAGYDLGKLLAGSWGTLGLLTEVTFRLHPRPPALAFVSLNAAGPEPAAAVALAAAVAPQAPAAVELAWPSAAAPVTVTACLEGSEASLAERADELGSVLADALPRRALSGPARGWVPSESDAVPVVADDPPPWWGATGPARGTVLRVAFWAGRLARVLTAIRAAAAPVGLDPSISGSGGVLHVALPAGAPAAAVARFVPALRAALAGLAEPGTAGPPAQASAVVLHAPPPVRDVVDLFGPVPALPLMRAVKDRFDPEDRLSPGRLAGL